LCNNVVPIKLTPGLPDPLLDEELAANTNRARDDIADVTTRAGQQRINTNNDDINMISDADIRALKLKFSFLADYSDSFIRHTKPECLVKLEATNLKMKEAERVRDYDDRLATNRMNASSHPRTVKGGLDDRCSNLHEARFLPGAVCSTAKLWLAARKLIGLNGADPLGNYDMAALGLGGQTTSKGWIDIADPSSTKATIRSFNINNCGQKSSGSSGKDSKEDKDFLEVAEFTVAIRTIRTAMHLVHPWNLSIVALENFLLNNKMCSADIGGLEKQAAILTRFTDYVLSENAARWRDETAFLNYNELTNTWNAFFSALPQSQLTKAKSEQKNNSGQASKQQKAYSSGSSSYGSKAGSKTWNLPYIEVCYKWNRGFCNKPDGSCKTGNGRALKHCCDERTDPTDLSIYCGKNHKRVDAHP
jgi:hypothetical protein